VIDVEAVRGRWPRWLIDVSVELPASELAELANAICTDPALADRLDLSQVARAFPLDRALEHLGARLASLQALIPAEKQAHLLGFHTQVAVALARFVATRRPPVADDESAALEARLAELAAIQRINNAANSTLDLNQVLDLTVQAVGDVLRADDCSIYLYEEELGRLVLRATTGLNPLAVGRAYLKLGEGVTGWAAQHGQPVALTDAWQDPRFVYLPELMEESFRSMLSVPIILFTVGKLNGVLNIQTRMPRQFSSDEIRFVETVCGQIAIAIENARLYEQTDEKLREKVTQLSTLQRVWASIASSLDLTQVLNMIARYATELSHTDKAAIFQLDERTNELHIVAAYQLSDQYKTVRVKVGEAAVGRAVALRTPVAVVDALSDPILESVYSLVLAEGYRSMFCVPLIIHDRVLGGISVYTRERHQFSEEQIQLLFTFAHDAAIAIENARLYQEAQRALSSQQVLLKELHHRVKNNLQTVASLLSLQMRRAESPEAAQLLGLSAARVQSIAAVHELLSQEDIGLATVEDIAARITSIVANDLVHPNQQISFVVKPAPFKISSKHATVLALVLNELVSNAVSHGHGHRPGGEVVISAEQRDGLITVLVQDNGEGLPPEFLLETHAGLGLHIIQHLMTEDLRGSFTIRNRAGGGTEAEITFPA